ncbi:MAG: peptide deformylase [Pseudomonadota bacterium]
MAIRDIITAPDPRLREVSKPVEAVDDDLRALMDDMLETMYDAPGIGLAAIQIGVPKRVIVMDLARSEDGEAPAPRYFVNPEILDPADEMKPYDEGCLSVPEFYEQVDRPATCTVKYLDYDGTPQVLEADGLLSVCIQHEMDHLNGVLFIDHLSRLKRDRILSKLKKQKKLTAAE